MKLLGTVQEIHDLQNKCRKMECDDCIFSKHEHYCVIFDTISYFDELEKFDRNMEVALEM